MEPWMFVAIAINFAPQLCLHIKIGNIYDPEEGKATSLSALKMAERDLRDDGIINNTTEFEFIQVEGSANEYDGIGAAAKLHCYHDVNVFVGPYHSTAMTPVLPAATYWDTTVVGYVSSSMAFSNKTEYPTLARTSSTSKSCGIATRDLLLHFNWTRIAVILHPNGQTAASGFLAVIGGYVEISYSYTFPLTGTVTDQMYDEIFTNIRLKARVVYVCLSFRPWDTRDFMLAAMIRNMTDPSYVYIIPFPIKDTLDQPPPWKSIGVSTVPDDTAKRAYLSVLLIEATGSDGATLTAANKQIAEFAATNQELLDMGVFNETNLVQDAFRLSLYSAMYLYGLAVRTCLDVNVTDFIHSGALMFQCFCYHTFTALGVRVSTNEQAERVSDYVVKTIDFDGTYSPAWELRAENYLCDPEENPAQFSQVDFSYKTGKAQSASTKKITKTICHKSFQVIRPHNWRTADNTPPPAIPECWFDGSKCVSADFGAVIGGIAAVLAVVTIGIAFAYYRKRRNKLLEATMFKWNLPRIDITLQNNAGSTTSMPGMFKSNRSYNLKNNKNSVDLDVSTNDFIPGVYSSAKYLGNRVLCKRLLITSKVEINEKELLVIKQIYEVNHENLNRFVGLCVDSRSDILILWGHCTKGPLKDILQEADIELDFAFRSSIIRDIVQGLEYLHKSALGYHGNLNSTNCLITSRWVVVLTDFGTNQLLSTKISSGIVVVERAILPDPATNDGRSMAHSQIPVAQRGSKERDIFDFGEILFEVITREDMPRSLTTALEQLQDCGRRGPFLLDKQGKVDTNKHLIKLFKDTRNRQVLQRPSILQVKLLTRNCSFSAKNLMDHMFGIMEKYANSLESIVSERTALLQEERRRADSLLYQMLPKTVADALKSGTSVEPETFDLATVYFSDVVGFTTICSDSSPMEVVAMLNSLYSQFDEIIGRHDCYKVETIGDAYLVVSGLPSRNGQQHVVEISDMAIEIISFVSEQFVIPHMLKRRMSVRIGIHSGPVAAGVVGLSMPRYCVFGDTVNVASRMESHGLPSKIHISWSTAELLSVLPNYSVEPRGENLIKGKGVCNTFWLQKPIRPQLSVT